jgi:hypothetical protein
MATLYKTDGTVTEVKPANGRAFTLEELRRHVGGDIEHLQLRGKHIWLDEEGKLKNKPRNPKAQEEANKYGFSMLTGGDYLVGDVLFCEGRTSTR